MSTTNRVSTNSFAVFDATLLTATYQVCDPGLPQASFLIRFVNTSDVAIFISYNGITDHDIVLAYNQVDLFFQQIKQDDRRLALQKGAPLYVRYELGAGKGGYLYVISYYHP